MGRGFVTFTEAAAHLKCSKRTVHNYVKRGLLRRQYEDGDVLLLQEDVEHLADEQGSHLPALTNRTLLELLGRIKTLEMKVSVFQKMHGIDELPPLRPSPEEAQKLAESAKYYLSRNSFTSAEIDFWVSLFMRMDELTFTLILKATNKEEFWQDFFNLCISLLDYVSSPKKFKSTDDLTKHHAELTECKRGLRSVVLVWIETGHGKTPQGLRRHLGEGKDDLVRRILSRNSNS